MEKDEKNFLERAWDDWDAGRVAVNDKAVIKQAWGDWLSENWTWEWYATLSFKDDIGTRRADFLFQKWYKQLTTETRKDVQYVRCEELQLYRGVPCTIN